MTLPVPLTRDLVLIGGGHSHALFLRMWGMRPLPGTRLTLVNPGATAFYSGMLPGYVAGHYQREHLELDLVHLARFAGARFVDGAVSHIDRTAARIDVPGQPAIRYDQLSIDIGIHTGMPELVGFAAHATPAKPLDRFARAWEAWCERLARGEVQPRICIIGAGIAGVELALAMAHRCETLGHPAAIRLLDSGRALDGVAGDSRAILFENLRQQGGVVEENVHVQEVTAEGVRLACGRRLEASFVLAASGARPHGWLADTGLDLHDGHIIVDSTLRSISDPAIHASGDCAHLGFAPRPKAGVFAVRAAPILYHNLRAALSGTSPKPFRPQKDYLKLVSLGGRRALADRSGVTLSGAWLWRWKDRIDKSFMNNLQALPPMSAPSLPTPRASGMDTLVGDAPLCGGCGAKIAGSELKQALARLPAPKRSDVVSLPGDDAAILAMGGDWQVLSTDHLRAFTEDPTTFARIAAVHALGDIWAMGARPQAALANITLPPMHPRMQAQTLSDMLETAASVFRAAGADLVGGHTSTGAEASIGFTLTGLSGPYPVTLSGARSGDALVLCRPLGSGTLLAGEMQGKARGDDVLAALAIMGQPQSDASVLLADANAMTDVTGFGLAGHLMGICEASGVGADIILADIPFYSGALALVESGLRATLHPANREVAARMILPEDVRSELLFDPQTAGGLLAAVPPETLRGRLDALLEAGIPAHCIGRITDGPPFITVR